ncbi:MAG: D-sedoheptulose 7-phosphate isomerase [Bacteroidetes bacterium]|nr:D-sedoheptulose 7-phosphate isomerase [Bacteroidota bacterium]HET6244841.1 D-sedoheptulose 7-phosphate isomerase [Bacteroidia bacterium]
MDNITLIKSRIQASIDVKVRLLENENTIKIIQDVAHELVRVFQGGGKALFCGNGGSAADAQHISAELSGRFYKDREPLNAEALHVNASYLTAVANDYSFDEVYSRMVKAAAKQGDILIGISTSGNSPNILKALETANAKGLVTVGLTGETGGKMNGLCKYLIKVPSNDTPRIQESHILIGHILCEIIENELFQ